MRVYTGGTFDLFHAGHVAFLRQARALGDELVVGLNTDEFAARYKRRPVMTLHERMLVVSSCRFVDEAIVNHGDEDSRPAILESRAAIVAHADDWTGADLMAQMGLTRDWLRTHGIRLAYVPYTKGVSTSQILERVRP